MPRAAGGPHVLDVARRGLWLPGAPRRHRRLFDFALQRGLLQLLLLRRERGCDAAPTLIVEIGGVLFVDSLLLLRRRIGTCDIESPVLHEIEIGVAAAGLAPPGEFRVAFRQRRGSGLPGRRLLGDVGAFLEVGRSARTPPLRLRAPRLQHGAARHRGHQQCECA